MAELRIGISGWNYKPWRGSFFPKKLRQADELAFASRQVNCLEINGSFYSLKKPADYRKWFEAVPDDFIFTVKGARFITHMKQLKNVGVPTANFFASGVLELEPKLGPILWQFSERMKFNPERFETFFDLLPKNTTEALHLAKSHDHRIKTKPTYKKQRQKIRHAVEVRNDSFHDRNFFKLLREHNIALVVSDGAGRWPIFEERTADFTYIRLHGGSELYVSGYDDPELSVWAKKIKKWKRHGDVYCFFDNDVKARAPFDAMAMLGKLTNFHPEYDFQIENRKRIHGPSQIKIRSKKSNK
jgi:uncharacterized protein YecE (DUF72 family)